MNLNIILLFNFISSKNKINKKVEKNSSLACILLYINTLIKNTPYFDLSIQFMKQGVGLSYHQSLLMFTLVLTPYVGRWLCHR